MIAIEAGAVLVALAAAAALVRIGFAIRRSYRFHHLPVYPSYTLRSHLYRGEGPIDDIDHEDWSDHE